MDQNQDWFAYRPSLAPGGHHGYFLPPAPSSQTPTDSHPLPWTYQSPVDELFVHGHHQTPVPVGGLPSPAPTGAEASPPDLLKLNLSPVNGRWSPASPMSPVGGDNGLLGCFNHQAEGSVYTSNGVALPSPTEWVSHDWTNTHFQFDHTYPNVAAGQSITSGGISDFSPVWTEPTPLTHPPNGEFVEREKKIEGGGSGEKAGALSAPMQGPNPPKRCKAARSSQITESASVNPPEATIEVKSTAHARALPKTSSGPGLRTATRRFKRAEPRPKPGETPERQRAKANHNMVEQQYRHRLHARFEALLDVLPDGILDGNQAEPTSSASARISKKQRRMSKVDVLNKAFHIIRFLESDNERTRQEVALLQRQRETEFGVQGS